MLKETKIGEVVIVAQTTYYVYESQEKREKDEFYLCTSNEKQIRRMKKALKDATFVHGEYKELTEPKITDKDSWWTGRNRVKTFASWQDAHKYWESINK
jgi:hypothetical protein